MGRREIGSLKAKVGECCISRRGADGSNSSVEVSKLEESEEKD